MTDTTRKHPRSLAEAFPRDYADPIERPDRSYPAGWPTCMAIICAVTLILVMVYR